MAWGATLFGYGSWNALLHRYPTALISPFALLIPVTGLASGALFLGETLAPVQAAGVVLVFAGLAVNVYGAATGGLARGDERRCPDRGSRVRRGNGRPAPGNDEKLAAPPSTSSGNATLLDHDLKPSAIVKYLDQYVIGQDDAKKIVAVAVYSHFKKIARLRRGRRPDRQEQHPAGRPDGHRQDAAVRDAVARRSACRSSPPRRRRSRRPGTSTRRSRRSCSGSSTGGRRRRRAAERHRLHRRDRQAQGGRRPGARRLRRERPARAAEDHGRRHGQAGPRRSTSTRPTSCSSAAARSSAWTRSRRRRTPTGSSPRRRTRTRASSTG